MGHSTKNTVTLVPISCIMTRSGFWFSRSWKRDSKMAFETVFAYLLWAR